MCDSFPAALLIIIYRFSQAYKRSCQAINWCSFLKNSPKTFRSEIYFGAFLARWLSKIVSQKARKCSELSSNILGISSLKASSKGDSRGWTQPDYFFFRASNWTHILLTSCLAWCLQCFHILSLTVKGLSNLLGLLAVRLTELETALIYNNKIKLIHDCLNGWSSSRSDVNK